MLFLSDILHSIQKQKEKQKETINVDTVIIEQCIAQYILQHAERIQHCGIDSSQHWKSEGLQHAFTMLYIQFIAAVQSMTDAASCLYQYIDSGIKQEKRKKLLRSMKIGTKNNHHYEWISMYHEEIIQNLSDEQKMDWYQKQLTSIVRSPDQVKDVTINRFEETNETNDTSQTNQNERYEEEEDRTKNVILRDGRRNGRLKGRVNGIFTQLHAQLREWKGGVFKINLQHEAGIDQGGVYRDILQNVVLEINTCHASLLLLQAETSAASASASASASDLLSLLPCFHPCSNLRDGLGNQNQEGILPNVLHHNDHNDNFCTKEERVEQQRGMRQAMVLIGQFMGIALLTDEPMNLQFPTIIWKLIVGEKIVWGDVCEYDHYTHLVIEQLQQITTDKELCAFFTEEDGPTWTIIDGAGHSVILRSSSNITNSTRLHSKRTHETKNENGMLSKNNLKHPLPLRLQDLPEYISEYQTYRMKEYHEIVTYLSQGLLQIIGIETIFCMNHFDLKVAVCGRQQNTTWSILKEHTVYHNDTKDQQTERWLNCILSEFDDVLFNKFVQFVWGRNSLPSSTSVWEREGYSFVVECQGNAQDDLPNAHTCTMTLDCPTYSSMEKMRSCLMIAIEFCGSISNV